MSATPMRDVRRLPFSTSLSGDRPLPGSARHSNQRPSSHRQSLLPPSPYTPFSGRRSGSVPPGTPQLQRSRTSVDRPSVPASGTASKSADLFARGAVDSDMRAVSVDTLGALARLPSTDSRERSLVEMLADAARDLMGKADTRARDRTTHPHVRREASALWYALRAELASWDLILAVWKTPDIRSRDLTSARLTPDYFDAAKIDAAAGVLKAQRIAQWLENEAATDLDRSGGPQVKPLDDPAYRWAYSAHRTNTESVSMDFDLRGGTLDDTETKAEERLCRELFRLLRAGRMDEAERVCRAAGQPWRAAIIAGGKSCSAVAANGRKGDARRAWRNAVASMARSNANIPPHERALYGLLAGVMEPALAVATDYESHAWVRITTALDAACDHALGEPGAEASTISDETLLQVFRECEGATVGHDGIPGEVHAQIREVRSYFSLGKDISVDHLEKLLEALSKLARTGLSLKIEWVCRMVAHMCIFLKYAEVLHDVVENATAMANFEDALQAYPRLVIEKDLDEDERAVEAGTILPVRPLVSELAARLLSELLNSEHIVNVYADLMCAALRADLRHERAEAQRVGVAPREVHDRRTLCLEKAGAHYDRETLDKLVLQVVDQVWDSHLLDGPDVGTGDADLIETTEDDQLVYRAIEFLMFPAYPNYSDAVLRATTAARRFFLCGRHGAARQLVEWFPSSVLAQSPSDECLVAMRELDAWRAYMNALARHSDWRGYFYSQRPMALPLNVRAAAVAPPGSVSYEVHAAASVQLEKFEAEMAGYERVVAKLCDGAVEALRTALLFDGGWMNFARGTVDPDADPEVAAYVQRRAEEIEAVRRMAIPQLVALLHNVLHESGFFSEAVEVATIVADDSTRLYESFGKQELQELLKQVADSAVLLADGCVKKGDTKRPYKGYFFEEFS